MLARAIPSILPDLTFEEALQITKIHSAAGRLEKGRIVTRRPFLSPHHSASTTALVGGGPHARPGEISMAHLGVLFLDELPEFQREALEALRQPLEDGVITIARVNATATYPARFMLVGAMNPCPCGNYGSQSRVCNCTESRILNYRRRLSGPLLDRMDIFIQMEEVTYQDLHGDREAGESSEAVRLRVNACRMIQRERFMGSGIFCNAQMGQREIERYCILDEGASRLYEYEFGQRGFSGRANARTLRLARTIADMEGRAVIGEDAVAEALQYRSVDERFWN